MKEQLRTSKAEHDGLKNIVVTGPGHVRYLTPDYEVICREGETVCSHADYPAIYDNRHVTRYDFNKSREHWMAAIFSTFLSPQNLSSLGSQGKQGASLIEVNAKCPILALEDIIAAHIARKESMKGEVVGT
mgnify:FL=1